EVKNVYIRGISSWHDNQGGKERGENTIYTIETEDLKICHLGDFGQNELTDEQLETIGEVDILMVPVGGVYTIETKEALKVMSQVEPKITLPMHYALPKLKVKLDGVDKFLKAVGVKSMEPLPKLTIKKKDLSAEEARIVVLEP
ncbi:MAG: MBL fold metallo-hydrolase, partial [bacterium]|nr:MBL fold metallo-hydrolase [bacterium]